MPTPPRDHAAERRASINDAAFIDRIRGARSAITEHADTLDATQRAAILMYALWGEERQAVCDMLHAARTDAELAGVVQECLGRRVSRRLAA